jgi:hypothetical protein
MPPLLRRHFRHAFIFAIFAISIVSFSPLFCVSMLSLPARAAADAGAIFATPRRCHYAMLLRHAADTLIR